MLAEIFGVTKAQARERADAGARVGEDPEHRAIAQTGVASQNGI